METRAGQSSSEFPIALWLGGSSIGAARAMAEETAGMFRLQGLDFIARVFFAERVGPGGPENTPLADLCVMDRAHRRTMRAPVATVVSFSAGTGELELVAKFAETSAETPAEG
jgi:hypothetical protein